MNTDSIKDYFKRFPRLYYVLVFLLGPIYLGELHGTSFLKKYHRSGQKVNIGSGPRRIGENVVNLDVEKYDDVDIVGDVHALPFLDGSISMVVCDNVLEHVLDPKKAISELYRVLEKEGVAYISTPFVYPFHNPPHHYTQWTINGLRELCKDFTVVEHGTRSGVFSALSVVLCRIIPSIFSFGSERLYWILFNLSLISFWPIKFLDIVANHLPFSEYTAATLYIVIKK